MSFLIKDDEGADRIHVEADAVLLDEPEPTPGLLGAGVSPTDDAEAQSIEGMAPCERSGEELWRGEGLRQGPSSDVSYQGTRENDKNRCLSFSRND